MAAQTNTINIRDELADALEIPLDFVGSFSLKQEYSSAPNPALNIEQIGPVGLPLCERDAMAIKSVAEQAPFGKGEHTVVDKSVRDTWEIDARLVRFRNPGWESFMSGVAMSACGALGVNYIASAPRCELYKLLLYETGSHFLPHVDTEKADGMFATVIVVLPSEFTGGDAHLSHGTLSTVYNSSNGSGYQTTVMAWYTDVTHEIKPITSGYRLALSYNLIHTTHSLRPALSTNSGFTGKVRDVLLAWNECLKTNPSAAPQKILYLLDHKYSQANLSASALKGPDAAKIALLETIAEDLDYHLGFACVECHLEGYGADHGYDGGWGYSDEDEDSPDSDVDFADVESRHASINDLVDLHGTPIAENIDFDENRETIPSSLIEDIESGPYDEQEYEGYMGNYAGSLERWYRRTVLIIWPDAKDCDVRFSGDNFDNACDNLNEPDGSGPTRSKVIEYLLNNASQDFCRVADSVGSFALNERDLVLWGRCVRACGSKDGFSRFELNELAKAVNVFGFCNIIPSLDILFEGDSSNQRRYGILKHLGDWAKLDPASKGIAEPWIQAKTTTFLRTLTKPASEEYLLFIELTVNHGGIEFFRESILPQIKDQVDATFLTSLAIELSKSAQLPPAEAKDTVITDMVTSAIGQTNFTILPPPPPPPQPCYMSWASRAPNNAASAEPNPVLVSTKNLIEICYTLKREELVNFVLEKLDNGLGNLQDLETYNKVRQLIIPTLEFLQEKRRRSEQGKPIPNLEKLLTTAVDIYFTSLSATNTLSFDRPTVTILLQALLSQGEMKSLFTSFLPKLLQIPPNSSGIATVFLELYSLQSQFIVPEGLSAISVQEVINSLVEKYVTTTLASSSSQVVEVLDNLLRVKAHEAILKYFSNKVFIQGGTAAELLEYLIASMRPRIEQYGLAVLAPLCQNILLHWIRTVLGDKPASNPTSVLSSITRWTCTCTHCIRAKTFLTSGTSRNLILERIGAPSRKHVEQQIGKFARLAATYDTVRTSPQGLNIMKTNVVWESCRWNTTCAKGRTMLRNLCANENELQILLGEHYHGVTGVLRGTVPNHVPASQVQAVAGPSTKTAGPPAKKRKVNVDPSTIIDLTQD